MWDDYGARGFSILYFSEVLPRLVDKGMLAENHLERFPVRRFGTTQKVVKHSFVFTELGKIPVGQLSFQRFTQIQETMTLEKLEALIQAAREPQPGKAAEVAIMDLEIYRTQLFRVLLQTLYFVKVSVAAGDAGPRVIYKIGVTQRSIEERMQEIRDALRSYFDKVSLEVMGHWKHRGNLELYFKHRYKRHRARIGEFTEYFAFDDERVKVAWKDFQ